MDKKGVGGVVILLILGVFMGGMGLLPTLEHHADVQEHRAIEATIVSSEVEVHPGDDTTYSPNIRYSYTVGGQRYTASNVFPGGFNRDFGTEFEAEDYVEDYSPGDQVTAYYNPSNPREAYLLNDGMPGFWLLGAAYGVIAGLGGFYYIRNGFSRRKQRQLMEDTPTETVESVSMGPSEVTGTAVVSNEEVMSAPFSEEECVLAEFKIEEYDGSGDDSTWRTREQNLWHTPFYVDDGTGQLLVEPDEDATIDLDPDDWQTTYVESGNTGPEPIEKFIRSHPNIGFASESSGKDNDRRYKQNLIRRGESVYVFGTVQPKDDPRGAGNASRAHIRKVREGDPMAEPMFLISDDDEKSLITRRKWALWRLPVGILFVILSLGVFVGIFGPQIGITLPILV